ncbi:g12917 [Coccomyxa viridis]|uniref:G12917 protein n=1 Tax=Coccomyxa viridis TaxID=1274662 RepID=A0ABP1GBH7_9CHLO
MHAFPLAGSVGRRAAPAVSCSPRPSLPQARVALRSGWSTVAPALSKSASCVRASPLQRSCVVRATAAEPLDLDPVENALAKVVGVKAAPQLTTLLFVVMWYGLNVAFNLLNKSIFNYFPFPYTVSAVHVVVGLLYCSVAYLVGAKKASFGRPINKEEFSTIFGPAAMHAVGHVAANLSFAAVAISLTHTVKTLEPAFNVLLSKIFLGVGTPLPVVSTLIPIMAGVALASASDLTFNWTGFISAMVSNLTFGFRAVWSKKAMGSIKNLDSTGIYAYTTLISTLICVPAALIMEGPYLKAAADKAVAAHPNFYTQLALVGLLYHLYNQFAFNTLSRVSPVSHGVCNVVKRVVIIGTSVLFFGTNLSNKTKIGTSIALLGTYLYTEATKRYKHAPKETPPSSNAVA